LTDKRPTRIAGRALTVVCVRVVALTLRTSNTHSHAPMSAVDDLMLQLKSMLTDGVKTADVLARPVMPFVTPCLGQALV
jgi:hypothetical protein